VLVLDQAGWHTSLRLRVPDHVHLLFLPTYSPELQPAEHLWPLANDALTNDALANVRFADLDALDEAQFARCAACSANPAAPLPPRCSPGGQRGLRNLTLRTGYSPTDAQDTHRATHHVGACWACPAP
jgi:hypothetical protein